MINKIKLLHIQFKVIFAKLKYIILALILSYNYIALGDFGSTCAQVPSNVTDNYLTSNTAYGHIMGNIDMLSYVADACNINDPNFKFCIRNSDNLPNSCTIVTLKLGDYVYLGSISSNPSLGGDSLLKKVILGVAQVTENTMCLIMPTSRGTIPIACKNTKPVVIPQEDDSQTTCNSIGQACYNFAKSQSLMNFSGVAVDCLKETLDNVFYQPKQCMYNQEVPLASLAPFATFQSKLTTTIRIALVLYFIFYGFQVLSNYEYLHLDKVVMFILKFLFITYFAVGLGPLTFIDGKISNRNAMAEYGLPFLASATSEFAYIVFNSGGSKGLCEFDRSKYPKGYEFYALWDSIDCRLGYYLGMKVLYDGASILQSLSKSTNNNPQAGNSISTEYKGGGIKVLGSVDAFLFFAVIFGFLMSGNIIIVISGLIFAVIFMSILLQFITSYLVCLITLYLMAYISPIFIASALFERTKSYFDSWLKVTLSCALQPAVLAGFIALLLTIYDTTIYKNCQFQRNDYNIKDINFSTFELKLPRYNYSECQSSIGYKLMRYYNGEGWKESGFALLFVLNYIEDIFGMAIDFIYLLVFTYIFYHFSTSFSQFAADITSGPIMNTVTASPQKVIDMAKKALNYAQLAARSAYGDGTAQKELAQESRKDLQNMATKEGDKDGGAEGGGKSDDMVSQISEGAGGGAAGGGGAGGGG